MCDCSVFEGARQLDGILLMKLVEKLSVAPMQQLPDDGEANVYVFIFGKGVINLRTTTENYDHGDWLTHNPSKKNFTFSDGAGKIILEEILTDGSTGESFSNPLRVLNMILAGHIGKAKQINELLKLT